MTPNDVVRVKRVQHLMSHVMRALAALPLISRLDESERTEKEDKLKKIFAILALQWRELVRVPEPLNEPLSKIGRLYPTISSFSDELVHDLFRFDSREQLRDLYRAFRFPFRFKTSTGQIFSGGEILLAGLFRLHAPNIQGDIGWRTVFGFDQPTTSKACAIFFDFMVANWGYLLQDNLDFWLPYLPQFAEKIRAKLESKGVFFPPGSFRVFGFTDNTMNATCRPGGGPTRTGEDAPRNDPLIQRA